MTLNACYVEEVFVPGHTHAHCKALILREYRGFCVHGATLRFLNDASFPSFLLVGSRDEHKGCHYVFAKTALLRVASVTLNSANRRFMLFQDAQYVFSLPFCWFGLGLCFLRNRERLNPAVYPPSPSVLASMLQFKPVRKTTCSNVEVYLLP